METLPSFMLEFVLPIVCQEHCLPRMNKSRYTSMNQVLRSEVTMQYWRLKIHISALMPKISEATFNIQTHTMHYCSHCVFWCLHFLPRVTSIPGPLSFIVTIQCAPSSTKLASTVVEAPGPNLNDQILSIPTHKQWSDCFGTWTWTLGDNSTA